MRWCPDTCGHCSRLNFVRRWQNAQDIVARPPARSFSPRELSHLEQIPSSSSLSLPIPLIPKYNVQQISFLGHDYSPSARQSANRKLALRYYIQTFTPMLTTSLENNGFLSGRCEAVCNFPQTCLISIQSYYLWRSRISCFLIC